MLASVFASSSSPSPAQSCFSFAVRSPLATFLHSLPPVRQELPQEEVYASPVQSVSAWRKQAKAEASAGIEQSGQVLVSLYSCDICGIHIGPGFYEQELFLWPLRNTTICRDKPVHYSAAILYACGGCARRRHLPEWLRAVQPAHWETTTLLCEQEIEARPTERTQLGEMKRVYSAIRQVVLAFAALLTTLSILYSGFSLQIFKPPVQVTMRMGTEKQEMAHALSTPVAKGQLLSFNRSLTSTTNTLATFLRTLPPRERNVVYA